MNIAISGASGFIGTHLTKAFTDKGMHVVPLVRDIFRPDNDELLKQTLAKSQVVINLAGAPINHRWTRAYKKELYDSRIHVTRKVVTAINSLDQKPELLISASAVGYYPSIGCFSECNGCAGKTFLSKLCVEWENESQKVSTDVRLVNTRLGVVLDTENGAFQPMALPAKLGIATIIGNGKQPISWIDIDDLTRAFEFIIKDKKISGIVNLAAPQYLDNKKFTQTIASHFKSRLTIKIPKIAFKLLLGESSIIVTEGQCVKPAKLLESGFKFNFDQLEKFLQQKINK